MQTAYNLMPTKAYAGMIATAESTNVRSLANASANPVKFGDALTYASPENSCKTIATSTNFIGFAIADSLMASSDGTVAYKTYETVPVLTRGVIWVEVTEAVAVGDSCYAIPSGDNKGKCCKTVDSNIATGGKFRTATTGAGIAEVEINLV